MDAVSMLDLYTAWLVVSGVKGRGDYGARAWSR
jgi:hypothetical protein